MSADAIAMSEVLRNSAELCGVEQQALSVLLIMAADVIDEQEHQIDELQKMEDRAADLFEFVSYD